MSIIIDILLFCFVNDSVKYASNGKIFLILDCDNVGIKLYKYIIILVKLIEHYVEY